MPIQTALYRVTRQELVWLAVREYVRMFWWFILPVPLFGIVAVLFGTGVIPVIGMIAVLWPFSLPARSVLATAKSARLFSKGCTMEADDEVVDFLGEPSDGPRLRFRVRLSDVRAYRESGGLGVLQTRRLAFAPVRTGAFESPGDHEAFRSLVARAIAERSA